MQQKIFVGYLLCAFYFFTYKDFITWTPNLRERLTSIVLDNLRPVALKTVSEVLEETITKKFDVEELTDKVMEKIIKARLRLYIIDYKFDESQNMQDVTTAEALVPTWMTIYVLKIPEI